MRNRISFRMYFWFSLVIFSRFRMFLVTCVLTMSFLHTLLPAYEVFFDFLVASSWHHLETAIQFESFILQAVQSPQ